MILSIFNKIRRIWNKKGFEVLLFATIIFIFFYWFFYTRDKKSGTYNLNYKYSPQKRKRRGPPKLSKGEAECRRVLEKLFSRKFPNQRPKYMFNSITGHNLEIDCYNEELKLGCEYHGQQHYKYTPFMHRTKDAFRNQQYRDQMKLQICTKLGINLIVVPYTIPIPKIENFIKSQLIKIGY